MVKSKNSMTTTINKSASSGFSDDEIRAIDAYVVDETKYDERFGYEVGPVGYVRMVQQGVDLGEDTEKYQVMGQIIEEATLKNEQEFGILFRGIQMPADDVSRYVEGFVFDQSGTSSWSESISESAKYAFRKDYALALKERTGKDSVPVMFVIQNGKHAAKISDISSSPEEQEWLVSRTRKHRVLGTHREYVEAYGEYIMFIDVEEV